MIPKLKEDNYVPFLSENRGKCFVNSVHFFSFLYPYLQGEITQASFFANVKPSFVFYVT